jgi:CubicO group peptidase (beta-lactamase class C family)
MNVKEQIDRSTQQVKLHSPAAVLRLYSVIAPAVTFAVILSLTACLPAEPQNVQELVDRQVGLLVQQKKLAGAAVAVLRSGDVQTFFYGEAKSGSSQAPNADTLYETGSVTKTFTAAGLALLVAEGVVALDTPVQELLPPGTRVPDWNGRKITLGDLASHLSGLPGLPTNLKVGLANLNDPYADYTISDLYEFLAEYELTREPGTACEYSNLGFALLGHALTLKSGLTYEQFIQTRLLDPLGLSDSAFELSPGQAARFAPPCRVSPFRSLGWGPVPARNWNLGIFAPAGALKSTLNDMVRYLKANMEPETTVLAGAASLLYTPRFVVTDEVKVALGWHTLSTADGSGEFIWHNGETGGYCSFVGFNAQNATGVVILSNTVAAKYTDPAAINILNGLDALP